ncbi:unnamed protein product [Caenorhabditis brenneri]
MCDICMILNYRVGAVRSRVAETGCDDDLNPYLMTFNRKNDNSDVLLDFQKQIFELFTKSKNFHFTVLIHQIKHYRYVPRVKKLGLEENVKVEDVEELIRNHSDLQALIIYKDLVGDISPESNIFQLGVLIVQYPSRPLACLTDHYEGRFAVFCTPRREDAQLFLEKWLRKECCENIKHVWIFLVTEEAFDDRLLVNFGEQRWDMSIMPEMYPYNKEDAHYVGALPNVFSCDGAYYNERFDGKVATVRLQENYMMFSVWDHRPCEISDISSGEDRIAWLMLFTRKSDNSDVLLDIQKHIFELFSKSPHFRFTVLIDQLKYYRYVPRVQKLGLLEETVKVEDVEELIRNHSDLQALIVYKDLYPSRPFTDFTDHYKGRFAVFCDSKREDVQLFLEKWLRKECCDHIKHVRLFLAPGVQIGDRLLENISEKRWGISTMPKIYPYDEEDAYYAGTRPNVFSFDGVFYTERFDGKVATVGFRKDYMMFSVWDKRPW